MDPRYWTFDVDRYINRAIPPPPWRHIPYPVARFLGYRREGDQPQGTGNLVPVFWAWIGVFCGVSVIEAVAAHIPSFKDHAAPIIVGSFVSLLSPISSYVCLDCTKQTVGLGTLADVRIGCSSSPRVLRDRIPPRPAAQRLLRADHIRRSGRRDMQALPSQRRL